MQQESFETAVGDLAQAMGLLVRRVRASSTSHELSLTQTTVLARLYREGPATVSELARAEGMRSQSMGASVADLEERGLIERCPHPTDGRQSNIVLTEKGVSLREEIRSTKRTWLAEKIARLEPDEQQALFGVTELLRRLGDM